jgi:Uma2 family endonuclease
MSALPNTIHYTFEEYRDLERTNETRYEYINGEIFMFSGATSNHNRIAGGVYVSLTNQFGKRPCEAFMSDLRVQVAPDRRYTYPDVVALCGEPEFLDDELDTLTNPTVIFEVLSKSTEKYDRGDKFRAYRGIPTLQVYVLLSQDAPFVEVYTRQPEAGTWVLRDYNGLDIAVTIEELGVTLKLADIYAKVTFPNDAEPPTESE